ncbi:hypothetical protein NPIL_215011 [Nephila pilipes]|uniref:Uncharacterized protein n=1 Tax=Nephila pilipes TaxID=299642 RepID=A0A8X6NPI3_NEPPI|nr:hypothetical protein NPIL_215011 [Nephila pilipes]
MKKGLQPPYEGRYKIVNRTEKVSQIFRHGKDVSVRGDRPKPAYVSKELVDIPAGMCRKEKESSRPNEVPYTGEENFTRNSSRQETTTRSDREERYNPNIAKNLPIASGGGYVWQSWFPTVVEGY